MQLHIGQRVKDGEEEEEEEDWEMFANRNISTTYDVIFVVQQQQ